VEAWLAQQSAMIKTADAIPGSAHTTVIAPMYGVTTL